MSADALGKSVSAATKFLRTIHEDLRGQIKSLDRLMSDRAWRPADPNKIGYLLGNSLNDGRVWVLDHFERWYVRTEASDSVDRVVAFVWYLYHDDGDAYEVPTVTGVVARLESSRPVNSLLQADWQIGALFRAAGSHPEPVPLTAEQARPFVPAARSAAALVVPLCELTNEDVILRRLVGPLLIAEGQLNLVTTPGALT